MDANLNVAAKVLRSWMEKMLIVSVGYHRNGRPRLFAGNTRGRPRGLILFVLLVVGSTRRDMSGLVLQLLRPMWDT